LIFALLATVTVALASIDLGAVAARIRGQVDQFFAKLHAA
jgi:hypothetical protein